MTTTADPHDPRHTALQLVRSIALSVPAYRRLLEENGIDVDTIAAMGDLSELPTTTKDTYRRVNDLTDLQNGRPAEIEQYPPAPDRPGLRRSGRAVNAAPITAPQCSAKFCAKAPTQNTGPPWPW